MVKWLGHCLQFLSMAASLKKVARMQQNASDQENCWDVEIWTGTTYNNGAGVPVEMSLVDKWIEADPNFASNIQNDQNLPSTSTKGSTTWHKLWDSKSVQRQSSDQYKMQKKEERRKKNRKTAKESRDRAKKNKLMAKKSNECLKLENIKLSDDIEMLKIKIENLKIVKDSIIHQESCKDKYNMVDVNDHSSVCSMPERTVDKIKDNNHIKIISHGKNVINDNICITGFDCYQQQKQRPIQQEVGAQAELSATQDYLLAQSDSYTFGSSGTSFQSLLGTFLTAVPANQVFIPMDSMNLSTTNEQQPLMPVRNFSGESFPNPVGNVSGELFPNPVGNVSGELFPNPVGNVSGEIFLNPVGSVSGESLLNPVGNVSGELFLNPVGNVSGELLLNPVGNVSGESFPHPVGNVSGELFPNPVGNVSGELFPNPVGNVSGESLLNPVGNVSGELFLNPVGNVSGELFLNPVGNVSGESFANPVRNVSDQSSLISVNNVSDQASPVKCVSEQVTANPSVLHNGTVFSGQRNISNVSLPRSNHHSTFERSWIVEANQNDDKETQELIKFFLE